MAGFPGDLLERAFHSDHGMEYNRTSHELRNERPSIRFYEVVLGQDQTWEGFRDEVFPSLVKYMKAKGLDPVRGTGIVITVFSGERFHLIEGPDLVSAYIENERLNEAAFATRVGRWLR
jgi:hypothetical protein